MLITDACGLALWILLIDSYHKSKTDTIAVSKLPFSHNSSVKQYLVTVFIIRFGYTAIIQMYLLVSSDRSINLIGFVVTLW